MLHATLVEAETLSSTARKISWTLSRLPGASLVLGAALVLAACSGGSGADVEQNPGNGNGPVVQTYNGPAPSTADVQSFKINLWDNIRSGNRCGTCHSESGGQQPMFARSDDVNLAYSAANTVVTLASPKDSLMVTKVGGGHNCWLSSDAVCADILTTWITNWAGELASSTGRQIQLEPPTPRDPGQSRNYPADQGLLYSQTVYPVVEQFCSNCHSSGSAVKQQPFFAEGPPTDLMAVAAAYEAAKPKMDLDDPANSRLVLRLRNESHNCWSASCANDATIMENAIAQFANAVPLTAVDPALLTSKASTLYEGTIASGGNRYEGSVIALYEFKSGQDCGDSITGACATAYDTSGVDPAMDLTLSAGVKWFGGWGLNFSGGKAQATTSASRKLHTMINATGEYSIEAWVTPGNVVQEDMRIVSYSGGLMARNFNLGQTMYNYDYFNRSDLTNANGDPQLSTPDAQEVLQASLQHVVATFDPVEGRKIYVDGVLVASLDPAPGGSLADWDDTFAFVLGNEVSGTRNWMGVIRLVAVYNRALTPAQILQNFEAGVGEKFFLMFDVTDLTSVPQSYVVFEAAQYDSYAYLFRKPFFISLDGSAAPNGIDIEGLRIGLNGAESHVGQSYANLDTAITSTTYSAATGQVLANLGAVLPLEKGPDTDEFFLTFDRIAANTYSRPAPVTPPPPTAQDLPPASDIGVRTYDEISATLSTITGVSQLDAGVQVAFDEVRQSLPAIESIEAFLSSHQASIAQLAIEYCNSMVDQMVANPGLAGTRFPGFPFTSGTAVAWNGTTDNAFIDPLLDSVLGAVALSTQPDRTTVKNELATLVHGGHPPRVGLVNMIPTNGTVAGSAARTQEIAKAVCAATIGNGAALVQ
jgi:concanavalin A-like lectin/glucanase superfamily protein